MQIENEHGYQNAVIWAFMLSHRLSKRVENIRISIFIKKISGIFPELMKDLNPQMVRAFWIPNALNKNKSISRYLVLK